MEKQDLTGAPIRAPETSADVDTPAASNFVRTIVEADNRKGTYGGRVVTRFPPEPNGYLHIGHAKSICLNFGLARDYDGLCNLRFDDTNPETEEVEFVESMKRDIRWLGFDWGERLFHAADYFEQLYGYAEHLVKTGHAYVDDLREEEIRTYRGTVTEPGRESPFRTRSVEENLALLRRMRSGAFNDGEKVLRAKIDMASVNMKMRDPLLYRIKHASHYRTGDEWCIYPMYDFAHPLSDAIEGITHSLCTLEFDNNRELYDWVLDHTVEEPRPRQYEFARLKLDYTVLSKRKLLQLVAEGHVNGWDDPRMPTVAALRRRGVTPNAIRKFCDLIGVSKADSRVDVGLFEHTIRDDLNFHAPRVMCVLRPLRVVIENYPAGQVEHLEASYWPHDVPREGSRTVPFTRELFVERGDFQATPEKKFYRLAPGREVRLRYAYIVKCVGVVRDENNGDVIELRCTYDPDTRSGAAQAGRSVRGTIHWVSAAHSVAAEVRLYDRLFRTQNPDDGVDFKEHLNPDSMVVLKESRIEPSVENDAQDTRYQFERQGYFWRDPVESKPGALVFNRIVPLRDSWAKVAKSTSHKRELTSGRRAEKGTQGRRARPSEARSPADGLSTVQRARFDRYVQQSGVGDADAAMLATDKALATLFEGGIAVHANPKSVANWVVNELQGAVNAASGDVKPIEGAHIGALVSLIDDGTISGRMAKDVLAEMLSTGGHPQEIVQEKGWIQMSDTEALKSVVRELVAAHPNKVAQYRSGKTGLAGFFVGQVMRETDGRANPAVVKRLVEEALA